MLRNQLPLLALVTAIAVGSARAGHADTILQPMILSGIGGAILFFIGLLVFSLLRAVLISAWNWRLPIGVKS